MKQQGIQIMEPPEYSRVRFHPWVGENYESERWGFRPMVLGESHYGSKSEDRATFTNEVVAKVVNREDHNFRTRVFAKTARSLLWAAEHEWPDRDQCRDFCHDALFNNFVQELVAAPRVAPDPAMWERSRAAFKEVIQIHRPGLIIVLGTRLWGKLREWCSIEHPHLAFVAIHHPSCSRWRYEPWVSKLRPEIEKARNQPTR